MHKYILLSAVLLLAGTIQAQPKGFQNTGFFADEIKQVCNGAAALSDDEVINLITNICEKTNNKNRFIIAPCTQVPNCYATVHNNRPYILYNTQFLASVKGLQFTNAKLPEGGVDWKVMTLLAHEIGHHIYMHLTNPDPNMNDREMELEADEFAGYAIYMLGGSLSQAQSVMYGSNIKEQDSYTHPGRTKRLDAIAKGYNRGQIMFPKTTEQTLPVITEDDAQVEIELKAAEAKYNKADYKAVFPVYTKYAEHKLISGRQLGHLGYMYENGKGTNIDHDKAMYYYKKASGLGQSWVYTNIGWMYQNGKGVTKDEFIAAEYYKKATESGDAQAHINLGILYANGRGVTKDYDQAIYNYKKAFEAGNSWGALNIGSLYENGLGVSQSYSEALKWYRKSADAGNDNAMVTIGYLYKTGRGVSKDSREAILWFEKADAAGNSWGATNIGHILSAGDGVERNYIKAAEWYKKGSDMGNAEAEANLGYLYLNGYGVTQDHAAAVALFKKSADKGHSLGQSNLGWMYEKGYGVSQDMEKAIELYKKAAKQGGSYGQDACKRLGINWQ